MDFESFAPNHISNFDNIPNYGNKIWHVVSTTHLIEDKREIKDFSKLLSASFFIRETLYEIRAW